MTTVGEGLLHYESAQRGVRFEKIVRGWAEEEFVLTRERVVVVIL
jgi:hypothetical protein